MASNTQYLSVVTPCVCSMPSLTIFIDTYTLASSDPGSSQGSLNSFVSSNPQTLNEPVITTITLNVSSLTGNENEYDLTTKIYNQMGTYLIQTNNNYLGFLSYAEELYPASFQTTRTEHVMGIWSQCNFKVSIPVNTTGANIQINSKPCYLTLDQAVNLYGVDIGFAYDACNTTATNNQIINMIREASSQISTWIKNPIVMSTIAREYRGNDQDYLILGIKPVWDFDQPRIRRRNLPDVYNLPQWGKFAYYLNHEDGLLKFRWHDSLTNNREPFYSQNLIYLTFVAGHMTIPDEIKSAVVELIRLKLHSNSEVEMFKAGGAQFKFWPYKDRVNRIMDMIRKYKMKFAI